MATTTPNFGWPVPTSGDLVKNGATAIEALGDAIDASLVDLEGGTTGQVLAKASNADMDFAWVAQDDSNAIQNSIVDAKGDLISATANDTPARLAVGNNGETLVADSSTSTGLRYSAIPGANLLANGSFDIWQRGTSGFTSNQSYSADRWFTFSSTTYNIAQETSIIPTGATNSLRVTITGAGGYANLQYAMEQSEVEKLAGQTVTFSVYLRANATYAGGSFNMSIQSNTTGNTQTGGTWTTVSGASTSHTPSTSAFTRVSVTGTVPTNAKGLAFYIGQNVGLGNGSIYYVALAKVEIGSTPTTWSRLGGTIQGELAACQRYYYRTNASQLYENFGIGSATATTTGNATVRLPVTMRTNPTAPEWSNLTFTNFGVGGGGAVTALTLASNANSNNNPTVAVTFSGGGGVAGSYYSLYANGSTSGYIAFTAEL
jgi:hypothetical protein